MDFNLEEILYNLYRMLGAFLLAVPLGWEREKKGHSAGLRTFPLVSLASCGYMLIGTSTFSIGGELHAEALSRVFYGLITGIGFIGGGAIIKSSSGVHGTATAASIWCTGAIGASVALNRFEIALLLSLMAFLIFQYKDNFFKVKRESSLDEK